ncbi:EAL and HDOD domain-containing protein [Sporosarcina siberiensis]|uniref:EAL and HDOD domain-containing protein n=1 Tax=Sporosarcina siberiensis TaxID=1365606 RepID=A0ABW4SBQ2_9BACL
MNVFVGRQPILDSNGKILGYELLYRNSEKNSFPNVNPEKATIELLINTFQLIGVDRISGSHLSFINFTAKLLTEDVFNSLDPKTVVIEILEDVEITPSLITKMYRLKEMGFDIALDDFVLNEEYEQNSILFNLITYIKVDFLATTTEEKRKTEKFLAKYPHIILLAEKVETEIEYRLAKEAGYTLFQGYYFAKPEIIKGYEIPQIVTNHFQIIEKINSDDASIKEIAGLIKKNISLSYNLLRFINSPGIGIPQKITSIQQAIVLMGLTQMRKWMHVLALREIRFQTANGRIHALTNYSMGRAKLCELLAIHAGKKNTDEYFLAGLFSLLNVIMGKEWDDILTHIPLSNLVNETLRGNQTEISMYLEVAEAAERFDWERLEVLAAQLGLTYEEILKYSNEAVRWSEDLNEA